MSESWPRFFQRNWAVRVLLDDRFGFVFDFGGQAWFNSDEWTPKELTDIGYTEITFDQFKALRLPPYPGEQPKPIVDADAKYRAIAEELAHASIHGDIGEDFYKKIEDKFFAIIKRHMEHA